MGKTAIITGLISILLIVGIVFLISSSQKSNPKLDEFATCLKDKGAIFYGAFWCSHCQKQKSLFGQAAKNLNYVECSTPDGKNQLEVCINKNIESYPTWEFSDGSRELGELSLEKLSEKTSCPLPQN